mmetsp:Transcript_38948/g.81857  ORF Transcript_38948/g.81857 Transcript_38948/m.81857 type:complete len:301 (-) Transcript_38948:463-1365(-)
MRGSNNFYNRGPSRGSNNNAYTNIYNDNADDGDDIVPPYSLKILGPLAPLLLSDDYNNLDKLQDRLRLFSLSLLGTSTFFWLWALYNTYDLRSSGGFDLGAFSFLGSIFSSSLLLRRSLGGKCYDTNRQCGCGSKKSEKENYDELDVYGRRSRRREEDTIHSPPGKCLRVFALLTQIIVSANYTLGILFAFTAGSRVYVYFATYCIIFTLLWAIVAFSGWVLIGVYREALVRAYGDEFVNGPPNRGRGLLRGALIALTNRSTGFDPEANNGPYDDDEEDDIIDDELRALYEGSSYTNATS